MNKILCKVTTTNTYVVEIDDSKWASVNDVAVDIAKWQSIHGQGDGFIDNYGYVTRDEQLPLSLAFDGDDDRKPVEGINMRIISENENINVTTESLIDNKGYCSINFTSENHC